MVKLYHISIYYKSSNNNLLKSSSDLSSFSFFQKKSAAELMNFTSKMIIERTEKASRVSVKEKEYLCHAYVRSDNLAGVIISDDEYPQRVAQTLLTKILEEFYVKIPSNLWSTASENSIKFNLDSYLVKYQNPQEADALSKLQMEIEDTKVILLDTISSLLQRGEKLEDLINKSDDLSAHSKIFLKTASKSNQCCTYF